MRVKNVRARAQFAQDPRDILPASDGNTQNAVFCRIFFRHGAVYRNIQHFLMVIFFLEIIKPALLDHIAVRQKDVIGADFLRLRQIMRTQQNRDLLRIEFADQAQDRLCGFRVESACRLGLRAFHAAGKPIAEEEEISVVYTYEHVQTGALLDAEPVEAGVYRVSAYSCENDHYLASEQNAVCTLTIQKAQAKIVLETDHADQTNKILTLRGYLPGVFDQPGGTITLYYKVSGQPDDEYAVAAERVSIRPIGAGSYGFFADAAVELNKTYDFKAVYQAGDVENYLIADGLLTNVGIKEVIDDEQDDEKTNGSNNGKDRNDAVDTGDAQPVFGYLLLMIAAAAVLIKLRKYAGR